MIWGTIVYGFATNFNNFGKAPNEYSFMILFILLMFGVYQYIDYYLISIGVLLCIKLNFNF